MEKYTRWADLTTGVNPFVPQQPKRQHNVLLRAGLGLGRIVLVLLRTPLVLLVTLALVLTTTLCSLLHVLPYVGRMTKRLTEWPLFSLLLLLLGVFPSEETANTRRLGLTAPNRKDTNKTTRVGPSDVLVCNHSSFVEVCYLAKRYSPSFAFVPQDGASKGLVHVCGVLEAIYRSLGMPRSLQQANAQKLQDVVANASGPVVVFPEGAKSNTKAVLKFLPVLEHLSLETKPKRGLRVHLVAFRYENKGYTPAHTAGGGWRHLAWTLSCAYHLMRVTVLDAKYTPLDPSTQSTTVPPAQVEQWRELIAAILRVKPVDLTVEDFVSFNAYWEHVRQGGRRPASDFTSRKAPHEHAQWTVAKK